MAEKIDNALKVVVIECLKNAFFNRTLEIEEYAENNSHNKFTIVNSANDFTNMEYSESDECIMISVINENNVIRVICDSYNLEGFSIALSLDIDNQITAFLGDLTLTEAELLEADFDARKIFDEVKELQQTFSNE